MTTVDAIRWSLADTLVMAGRSLRHWRRQPELLLLSTAQPVLLVLLFTQVFAGAVATPGMRYVDWLLPGVLVQVVAWDSAKTAVGVAEDLASSTLERLRTLPMSAPAVLAGRTLADAGRNLLVVLTMLAAGALVGLRIPGGPVATTAAVALTVAFGYALTWLFAYVGLRSRGGEAALAAGILVVFPLMFASSALVPVETMPAWLRPLAAHQPLTAVIDAVRALMQGRPAAGAVAAALAWTAGILALAVPAAVRRYRHVSI
jgi:ABC-2 type transport system permease protein/oleandomycin transport system permease protein